MKYTTVKISGVITAIAETTDVEGYTISRIESCLPSNEELHKMTEKQVTRWIEHNNELMQHLCDFMNKID